MEITVFGSISGVVKGWEGLAADVDHEKKGVGNCITVDLEGFVG